MTAHGLLRCIQGMFVLLRRLASLLAAQGPKGGGIRAQWTAVLPSKQNQRALPPACAGMRPSLVGPRSARAQDPPKCKAGRFRNGDLVIAMGSPAQNARNAKLEDWILGPSAPFSTFQLSGVHHNVIEDIAWLHGLIMAGC